MVKAAIIDRFDERKDAQYFIQAEMNVRINPDDLIVSLCEMDWDFQKVKFNEKENFTLIRNAILKITGIVQLAILRGVSDFITGKKSVWTYKMEWPILIR